MSQQTINVGSASGDGTGDPGRTAFQKVNANFAELYAGTNYNVVRDYGADNTGTNDCHTAIQAAITAAQSAGGGVVYLPQGTYKLTSALTVSADNVVICGAGRGFFGATAPTRIVCSANGFINASGSFYCLTVRDLTVYSTSGSSGDVINIGTASIADLRLINISTGGMNRAINLTGAGTIVCGYIEDCTFTASRTAHVEIGVDGIPNAMNYVNTRFEDVSGPHFKNRGITSSSLKFDNCVFEGSQNLYAVDMGDNFHSVTFKSCHWEDNCHNNGGGPYNNGADVYLGFGGSAYFDSCFFGYPESSATGFHNIHCGYSQQNLTAVNCQVNGSNQAGYAGFVYKAGANLGATFIGNHYVQFTAADYLADVTNPVRINDNYESPKWGLSIEPVIKSVTTTDATPTLLFDSGLSAFNASESLWVEADVVGSNASNSVYFQQTLRSLITTDASTVPTIQGSNNSTAIKSGAQTAALAIISHTAPTAGLGLTVVGVAATTIKWACRIRYLRVCA